MANDFEQRLPGLRNMKCVRAIPWNQRTIAEFNTKKGLGIGRWGDHLLLMTAIGARSGEAITTPLVYGREGDDYVIVASQGGTPTNPHWFGNVKANPDVEIEVAKDGGTGKFKARASVVESRERRDKLFRYMTTIWPSYADYQKRTERIIPVVVLKRQR